jgi:DNA-binding HxlR family transcriptional regulator
VKTSQKHTCAIAVSIQHLGDKWSLLLLRDMVMHKKTRFKEFRSSKEKIATNVLTNRLKHLQTEGFIKKLDPLGTKKSTRYIATDKGISSLPIIIELYLFSIQSLDESILDESQMRIKDEICIDRDFFEAKKKEDYLDFITDLKESLEVSNLLIQVS